MNPKQEFNNLYTDVSRNIAVAMAEIDKLEVEHKDGKQALTKISSRLKDIQNNFDSELKTLDECSEWEKFTIAFFGETNAGKSTIIESLRILFDEDSRQKLLRENLDDLEMYEKNLLSHASEVRERLNDIYIDYAIKIQEITSGVTTLSQIMQSESATRIKRKMWIVAIGGGLAGATLTALVPMLMGK